MAPELKRKRGAVEGSDISKRVKAIKKTASDPATKPEKVVIASGFDQAFAGLDRMKEIAHSGGINGDCHVETEEFEQVTKKLRKQRNNGLDTAKELVFPHGTNGDGSHKLDGSKEKPVKLSKRERRSKALKTKSSTEWTLSNSIAGRMLNMEPVFTQDEKHIIVASRTIIHVYATSNSLLTRSIKLEIRDPQSNIRIVAYCLSPTTPNTIWVACSDGSIYNVDWATGSGASQSWKVSSTGCIHMTVASIESVGRRRDVVLTAEPGKTEGSRITANELTSPGSGIATVARTIYTSKSEIGFLKTACEGSVIVAAAGNKVIIGHIRLFDFDTVDKIRYEFRMFESPSAISSLDVKAVPGTAERPKKTPAKVVPIPIADLTVGDVRGAIFVHNDILRKLHLSQGSAPKAQGANLTPRKYHWHRQAVNTVKWSLDGNYIVSGGHETVLSIWQLDTAKQQFLPHLTSSIQHVVVSPSGTSYGIQLADNSTMILSTAELSPTTNFAGIQASAMAEAGRPEAEVLRLREESWIPPLVQHTPAVIDPNASSQLLLAVGQVQEIDPERPLVIGSPFLQRFDFASGHSVSRQALTTTNVTNINITPNSHRVSEPRTVHMRISHDGNWLATVEEWRPPARDLSYLRLPRELLEEEQINRREVFLKFWGRNETDGSWELVTRIDAPHTRSQSSTSPGRVLGLVADPESSGFATIGEDNIACIWSTKTRKKGTLVVRDDSKKVLLTWFCQHAISLGRQELSDELGGVDPPVTGGSIAFSDDGSVLAAASTSGSGVVQLINTSSGQIRQSQTGLFEGNLTKLDFLGQDLIILADQLVLYDLVSNEIRLDVQLDDSMVGLSNTQKQEMIHLAVDRNSRTFAFALPALPNRMKDGVQKWQSELFVFQQDQGEPQLHSLLPTIVTALLPSIDSDGYLVIDTAAEIRMIHKKSSHVTTALAQSTSALNLDDGPDSLELAVDRTEEDEEEEETEKQQLPTPEATEDGSDDEDDENDAPVVTQQQLAEVFDIGPSFALPPMEEMFYLVAGLFSSKPLTQIVS
ncbi:WD repeat-containing protein-like protein [Amylocarpus encephaloides]|uniref:WD repeat-containing protein-like protein n=1 Tax=Amylocarpus encephaloides TaxID=45428 RepID=A0A9P7YS48_9HELO|nr:WD repeat-containing protein-like protein [Amylocarpus encephaloides]